MVKLKRTLLAFLIISLVLGLSSKSVWGQPKESKPEQPKVIKNMVVVTIVGPKLTDFNSQQTPTVFGLGKEGIEANGVAHQAISSSDDAVTALLRTSSQGNLASVYRSMSRRTLLYDPKLSLSSIKQSFNYSTQSFSQFVKMFNEERPFLSVLSVEIGKGGIKNLRDADLLIARLVGQLHNLGLYDDSMVVVVGLQKGPEGVNKGDAVVKGVNLKNGYNSPICQLEDFAPTLLFVTDGKTVKGGPGQILWPFLKVDSPQLENNLLQKRIAELSTKQGDLLKDRYTYEQTKESMVHERERLNQEKVAIHSEIDKRDRRIASLELQRNLIVVGFSLVILLMLLGYLIEYLLLRKRFLMF